MESVWCVVLLGRKAGAGPSDTQLCGVTLWCPDELSHMVTINLENKGDLSHGALHRGKFGSKDHCPHLRAGSVTPKVRVES